MITPKTFFSLFTGCGGIEVGLYENFPSIQCLGWSEIDKSAIKVFKHHFKNHGHLNFGDIERLVFDLDGKILVPNPNRIKCLPDFDLLIGGFPCSELSVCGSRKGLEGNKSRLFFAYLEVLRYKRPAHFLVENVASMSSDARDKITQYLKEAYKGQVYMKEIDSIAVTPQHRKRYYWSSWEIDEIEDRNVRWPKALAWSKSTRYKDIQTGKIYSSPSYDRERYIEQRERRDGTLNTLLTGKGCSSFSTANYIVDGSEKRHLTPEECEILQGFPKGWTSLVSDSERYKLMGLSVTTKVISHIFNSLCQKISKDSNRWR